MPKRERKKKHSKQVKLHRDYCMILDSSKHGRNVVCKFHDNAYGIRGGGTGADRLRADKLMYEQLKANKDPMAWIVYKTTRLFGWMFFNYRKGLWSGQLSKRLSRKTEK
jgi:hypothetical protein